MAPPGRSKGKQPARPRDETLRFNPTPKTQGLYNAFRQLEDAKPQTSFASPASSHTHPTADTETNDGQPPAKKQKAQQKAQRNGPLDELKRAKAAFMRAIRACQDCNRRGVACSHYDRTPFEQQYQAQRQNPDATPLGEWARSPPTPLASVALDQTGTGFSQTRTTSTFHNPPPSYTGTASRGPSTPSQPFLPAPAPNSLFHTGSWDNGNIPLGERRDEWNHDLGKIERSLPRGPIPTPTTSELPAPLGIPGRASTSTSVPPVQQTLPVPNPPQQGGMLQGGLSPMNFAAPKSGDLRLIGIARRLEEPHYPAWECKYVEDAIPGSEIEPLACNQTFPSLPQVIAHFEKDHVALVSNWSTWKCRSITTREGDPKLVCCDTPLATVIGDPVANRSWCVVCLGDRWEYWQDGLVSTLPGSTKGAAARVGSRDDGFADGRWSSRKHPPAQAFLDPSFNEVWPGRDMGGSYWGSQRSQDPLKTMAYGVRQWAKRWKIPQRWGPAATLVITVAYLPSLEAFVGKCLLSLASKSVETTRDIVFWGSLSCLVAGAVLMWWLLKYIQSRPSRGRNKPRPANSELMGMGGWAMPSGDQVHRRSAIEP